MSKSSETAIQTLSSISGVEERRAMLHQFSKNMGEKIEKEGQLAVPQNTPIKAPGTPKNQEQMRSSGTPQSTGVPTGNAIVRRFQPLPLQNSVQTVRQLLAPAHPLGQCLSCGTFTYAAIVSKAPQTPVSSLPSSSETRSAVDVPQPENLPELPRDWTLEKSDSPEEVKKLPLRHYLFSGRQKSNYRSFSPLRNLLKSSKEPKQPEEPEERESGADVAAPLAAVGQGMTQGGKTRVLVIRRKFFLKKKDDDNNNSTERAATPSGLPIDENQRPLKIIRRVQMKREAADNDPSNTPSASAACRQPEDSPQSSKRPRLCEQMMKDRLSGVYQQKQVKFRPLGIPTMVRRAQVNVDGTEDSGSLPRVIEQPCRPQSASSSNHGGCDPKDCETFEEASASVRNWKSLGFPYDDYAPRYLYQHLEQHTALPRLVDKIPSPQALFERVQEDKRKKGEPTESVISPSGITLQRNVRKIQKDQERKGWVRVQQ